MANPDEVTVQKKWFEGLLEQSKKLTNDSESLNNDETTVELLKLLGSIARLTGYISSANAILGKSREEDCRQK